jgi:hypothetical protein
VSRAVCTRGVRVVERGGFPNLNITSITRHAPFPNSFVPPPARPTNLSALLVIALLAFSLLLNLRSLYSPAQHTPPLFANVTDQAFRVGPRSPYHRTGSWNLEPGAPGERGDRRIRRYLLRTRRDAGVHPLSAQGERSFGPQNPPDRAFPLTIKYLPSPNQLSNRH